MGYLCKYCGKTYALTNKLKVHSLKFHGEYNPKDYYLNSYTCKICNRHYKSIYSYRGHCSGHSRLGKIRKPNSLRSKRDKKTKNPQYVPTCRFCFKNFESFYKLSGHVPACTHNPNRDVNLEKIKEASKRQIGVPLSEKTRLKISESMQLAVKEGRQKTPKAYGRAISYRNIKGKEFILQSSWELIVAKELNSLGVLWTKGRHGFPYSHMGKSRRYFPDFYICGRRTYIEVKGYITDLDRSKWEYFPKNLNFFVIGKEEMANIKESLSRILN